MKANNVFRKINFTKTGFFLVSIMGFFLCQNIFVPITIGSTPFNIFLILLPFFFVWFFCKRDNRLSYYIHKCPTLCFAFLAMIAFSLLPALFVGPKIGGVLPYFKGVIFYALSAVLPFVFFLFMPQKYRRCFYIGLLVGFVANAIASLIACLWFNLFGYSLTFYWLFPNNSFYVPNYSFRAQGLFLEPSHYAGFMLVSYYILVWHFNQKAIRLPLTGLSWVAFWLCGGGNFVLFVLSQIGFFIVLFRKKGLRVFKEKIRPNKIRFTIFIFGIVLLFGGLAFLALGPLRTKLLSLLAEANPFDPNNKERFVSFSVGLQIATRNPLGVGFNLSGAYIRTYYSDILVTNTTHSYLMTLADELGFAGLLLFLGVVGFALVRIAPTIDGGALLGIGFASGILFAFLDGRNEPYLYVSFAILCSAGKFDPHLLNSKKSRLRRLWTKLNI